MPFIRLDEEGFEVDGEDNITYTGSFSYHTAEEIAYKPRPFDPLQLTAGPAAVYAMLKSIGIVEFHVSYDGGHDEGFSHARGGTTSDQQVRSIEWVVDQLATPANISILKSSPDLNDPRQKHIAEYYANLAPTDLASQALDELADEMASCLFGNSYGTGEYSMYGEFVADLINGQLIDNPSAEKPQNVNFD